MDTILQLLCPLGGNTIWIQFCSCPTLQIAMIAKGNLLFTTIYSASKEQCLHMSPLLLLHIILYYHKIYVRASKFITSILIPVLWLMHLVLGCPICKFFHLYRSTKFRKETSYSRGRSNQTTTKQEYNTLPVYPPITKATLHATIPTTTIIGRTVSGSPQMYWRQCKWHSQILIMPIGNAKRTLTSKRNR